MNIFTLQVKLLIAAALIALAGAAYWRHGVTEHRRGMEEVRAELRVAAATAAESARIISSQKATANEAIDKSINQRIRASEAVAAAERGTVDRLRKQLADLGQPSAGDPATACSVDDGRLEVYGRLLGEAFGLAQEGRDRIDRLAAEKAELQRYQSEVGQVHLTK